MIDIDLDVYVLDGRQQEFLGACLDTEATLSVVGREQAEEYCRMMDVPLVVEPKRNITFKFSSERKPSKGLVKFWIPYAGDKIINISLDVVDINVPLILGLDKLDEYKMYVNNVENILVCTEPEHKHPITRKLGHLWYEWTKDVFYTDAEIKRIYRHFYHPQPEKVYNFLQKSEDPDATPDTFKQLQDITQSSDICQRLSGQPVHFTVSLPSDDIVFNRTLFIDLVSRSSKRVLHIVCNDTLFSAAILVSSESTLEIWND